MPRLREEAYMSTQIGCIFDSWLALLRWWAQCQVASDSGSSDTSLNGVCRGDWLDCFKEYVRLGLLGTLKPYFGAQGAQQPELYGSNARMSISPLNWLVHSLHLPHPCCIVTTSTRLLLLLCIHLLRRGAPHCPCCRRGCTPRPVGCAADCC
eukprot:GHUV01036952.1.p1 GENE.GHUV01036952.1~~GHUV01036952.1.p1  ORF type:complete len:152 (-),score=15.68 GHUV01036952.1:277-732(-)